MISITFLFLCVKELEWKVVSRLMSLHVKKGGSFGQTSFLVSPFHTTSPQTPPLSHACSLGETGGENNDGLDLLLGRAIRGLGLDLLQGGDQVVQNRRNVLCNGLVNGVSKGNQGVLDPCQLKRQWEFGQFFERTRKKRGK